MGKGTPLSVLEVAFNIVGLSRKHKFVDLGCRDGRVPILASLTRNCSSVGFEIDSKYAKIAIDTVKRMKLEHKVIIYNGDLFEADLSKYDVIYIFQSGGLLKKISKKLRKEGKHAKIIALDYPICKMSPNKTVVVGNRRLYFYGDVS